MSEEHRSQIYHTVSLIPEGKVASYGQIADLAGLPGRARLVGLYLKQHDPTRNLPWHRVVKSNGQIAFPNGSDKAIEQCQRIMSEGVLVNNNYIEMKKYKWDPDLTDILYRLAF
ncbi:MGMT family protein [Alteromonas sp. ASW11-130]|uniref:MGMT family protein n=1 Tax=Alteromonas sp. ASW11-130 TaxID=3015775 RepID=UPI0022424C23|nr:MGMT family protein [Alteromonas sp. ASW11-130]MCW8093407.1 MGMT family protein [Alteromonas sp. ASW11-130]